MLSSTTKDVTRMSRAAAIGLLLLAAASTAEARERIRIPVGGAEVVTSTDEIRTVAIAEPKIADAAVGSQRTVVVSGKSAGVTTLVVYGDGGRHAVYDVEIYRRNSDRQVALHVRVAEVTDQAKRELGIDFHGSGVRDGFRGEGGILTGKVTPLPVPPLAFGPTTDGRFGFTNRGGNFTFQAAWKALEEKGAVKLLANPTLVAGSGDSASFLAGGEIPIPVSSASGLGGTSISIEWKEYGVRVAFRPTVQDDGSIDLNVSPEVSALDFANSIKLSDTEIPALISRRTSTSVHLKPGEHLVIGGLKQTERAKTVRRVPILGQIPLVGLLFTTSNVQKIDRELVVVVSPELQEPSATMPELPSDRPDSK